MDKEFLVIMMDGSYWLVTAPNKYSALSLAKKEAEDVFSDPNSPHVKPELLYELNDPAWIRLPDRNEA